MCCPKCGSKDIIKYGRNASGTPRFRCNDCGRQFVRNPKWQPISQEKKTQIDKLLLERISLAGIGRVVEVSNDWLQKYINRKYEAVSRKLDVIPKAKGRLVIELDEMWSFVGNHQEKQWLWLALDRETREIVGLHIGDRGRESAQALWKSLPPVYRQCSICYSDFWHAYQDVLPSNRHRAVGKETGETNHIERLNNTLRQRVARLARKTLSFSKKLANHIGAIWYFAHHYNERRRADIEARALFV